MSARANWRGERRIRVALEFNAEGVRLANLKPLDGPAVQRPVLEGTHLAEVSIGGTTALIQTFHDPRGVRGISRPGQPGHSFVRTDKAIVYVDVPIAQQGPLGEIAITVTDLSKLRQRPGNMAEAQALLDRGAKAMRAVGRITDAQLRAHPDWATLGVAGTSVQPRAGYYEIYRDRAKSFRWRLRHVDGRIVAESAEPYPNRADCEADLRWIKEGGNRAPIRSLDIPTQPPPTRQRKRRT